MAPTFRLSPESLQMIENICNGFRRFENYHIVQLMIIGVLEHFMLMFITWDAFVLNICFVPL